MHTTPDRDSQLVSLFATSKLPARPPPPTPPILVQWGPRTPSHRNGCSKAFPGGHEDALVIAIGGMGTRWSQVRGNIRLIAHRVHTGSPVLQHSLLCARLGASRPHGLREDTRDTSTMLAQMARLSFASRLFVDARAPCGHRHSEYASSEPVGAVDAGRMLSQPPQFERDPHRAPCSKGTPPRQADLRRDLRMTVPNAALAFFFNPLRTSVHTKRVRTPIASV